METELKGFSRPDGDIGIRNYVAIILIDIHWVAKLLACFYKVTEVSSSVYEAENFLTARHHYDNYNHNYEDDLEFRL
jgi:altronate dehydratase